MRERSPDAGVWVPGLSSFRIQNSTGQSEPHPALPQNAGAVARAAYIFFKKYRPISR